jgi:energy-coupling factor transport system ATP-binding protein
MVPQNASDLLYLPTVAQELKESDRLSQAEPNSTSNIFESLIGRIDPAVHPRDLSAGQQLALVISIQLAQGSKIVFLDEPTRGLDNESKRALEMQLRKLSRQGTSILIATHDFDFAKHLAHRTLEMLNGKLSPSRGVSK